MHKTAVACNATRAAQTLTPILAAVWVALNDHEVSEVEAEALMVEMNIQAEHDRISDSQDEGDAFDHLLGKLIKVSVEGRNTEITVAEAIACARHEIRTGRAGDYTRALGRYGMKVDRDEKRMEFLYVNPRDFQFQSIYAQTKWWRMDLGDILKRLPTASTKSTSSTKSIGGRSVRAVEIGLPADLVEASLAERLDSEG